MSDATGPYFCSRRRLSGTFRREFPPECQVPGCVSALLLPRVGDPDIHRVRADRLSYPTAIQLTPGTTASL